MSLRYRKISFISYFNSEYIEVIFKDFGLEGILEMQQFPFVKKGVTGVMLKHTPNSGNQFKHFHVVTSSRKTILF